MKQVAALGAIVPVSALRHNAVSPQSERAIAILGLAYGARMSGNRKMGSAVAVLAVTCVLSACGPPGTGVIGIGVDDSGRPIGQLKVCEGEHMDGAFLYVEHDSNIDRPVGSWEARPAATGLTSWSFERPSSGWVLNGPAPALKPKVVYNLGAGADDGSGTSGYVLFTLEDLRAMKPGQVRIYDYTRPQPAGEPTGSPEQQAREENDQFMRVVARRDFEQGSCRQ